MRKQSFNANLDPDMMEWLRKEAERRRVSMNQVLRDLVIKAMAEQVQK